MASLILTMIPYAAVPAGLLFLGRSREETRAWFWLLQLLLFAYTFGCILILRGLSGVLFPALFIFSLMLSILCSGDRRAKVEYQPGPWGR